MSKKITYTKWSGTTSWFNIMSRSSQHAIRIIDQTGDGLTKRCIVFMKNNESFVDTFVQPWLEFIITPNSPAPQFDFSGDDYIQASFGDTVIPTLKAIKGNQYGTTGIDSMIVQDSEIVNAFSVYNNEAQDMTLRIFRNSHLVWQQTLASDQSQLFDYRQRFWVGIINAEDDFDTSVFNTEISTLGVKKADIVIGKQSGIYTFNLSNIVF